MLPWLRRIGLRAVVALLVCLIAIVGVAEPIVVDAAKTTTTLKGNNGTWKVETENNCIEIKFTPDDKKVKCKKIVFVQIIQELVDGKPVTKYTDTNTPEWKYKNDDMTDKGWVVDHLACEKDPYYNGDDKQDIGKSGSAGSTTPATMEDCPTYPDGEFPAGAKQGTYKFETAAYCADTGKFLGSINWEFNRKKGDAGKGEAKVTSTSVNETPSENLKKALKKFEDNHHKAHIISEMGPDGMPYIVEWWVERYCPDK